MGTIALPSEPMREAAQRLDATLERLTQQTRYYTQLALNAAEAVPAQDLRTALCSVLEQLQMALQNEFAAWEALAKGIVAAANAADSTEAGIAAGLQAKADTIGARATQVAAMGQALASGVAAGVIVPPVEPAPPVAEQLAQIRQNLERMEWQAEQPPNSARLSPVDPSEHRTRAETPGRDTGVLGGDTADS